MRLKPFVSSLKKSGDIEDYWIDSINKFRDDKYNTAQWIKPPVTRDIKRGNQSPLSYQMPEKPFEICKEDLSVYSLPKYYDFVESLPKTLYGKVDYKKLEKDEEEKKNNK
jgi:acyl-CoA synthetase (AMP-forming)/AMP-acid ligase II